MASQYTRHMSLLFSGCLFSAEAVSQRLDFVEDDILDDVDLSNNSVVDDSRIGSLIQKLADQNGCCRLNLSGTAIESNVMSGIASLLATSSMLHTLEIKKLLSTPSRDWLSMSVSLCAGLTNSRSLMRLDISENREFSEFGATIVQAVQRCTSLRELAMSGIEFRVAPLLLQNAFSHLEALEIGCNHADFSAVNWSSMTNLTSLNLRGAQGIGPLEHIVTATSLKYLDVSETPLTEAGCRNISRLLQNAGCSLVSLLVAHASVDAANLLLLLQAINSNTSLRDTVDLSGSEVGHADTETWGLLARRLHQIRRVTLRRCGLASIHIEELVRTVFECPNVAFTLAELDVSDNYIGDADDGADWLAELLAFPRITQLYCGNNNIKNGTAIYLKLRSQKGDRNLCCEVCASRNDAPFPNHFTFDQREWLYRNGFTKLPPRR